MPDLPNPPTEMGPLTSPTEDGAEGVTAEAPPFRAAAPRSPQPVAHAGLPTPGQRLHDFELLRILGAGSFARVYLARQISLERQVALKVSLNRGEEARTLASLEHDHIVRVFSEVIDTERDLRLLCMQYVPGTTLEQVIQTLHGRPREQRCGQAVLDAVDALCTDPAPLDLAALRDRELLGELDFIEAGCWMGARLAEALAHAHSHGVLHRDIKPANILVNRYGRPMLVDFNIAVARRGDGRTDSSFGGTLAYMAPEHLDAFNPDENTPSEVVDARSDIYSLGVVLFELFTGRLPFDLPVQGSSMTGYLRQLAEQRRQAPPLLASHLNAPPALERLLARCLAPRPEERFQNAAELAAALESCRELRHVEHELPQAGRLTRLTQDYPFLVAAVLLPLPHILGSIVNVSYNKLRIVGQLTGEQQETFLRLVLVYNAVVYPICLALFFRQIFPVFRTWQHLSQPGPVNHAEVDDARQRALSLPWWAIVLSCVGWLPGGLLFPLWLHLVAGPIEPRVFAQFLFSFTVSGLIALTYSVIGVEFVVVRVLYPGLWLDGRALRRQARSDLEREEARLSVLQFLAVLIPLAGAALILGVGPDEFRPRVPPEQVSQADVMPEAERIATEEASREAYRRFRLLVTALLAAGMVGLGLALWGGKELRQTVRALSARQGGGRRQ